MQQLIFHLRDGLSHPPHLATALHHIRIGRFMALCHAIYFGSLYFDLHFFYVAMGLPLMLLCLLVALIGGES